MFQFWNVVPHENWPKFIQIFKNALKTSITIFTAKILE